jgi:hypothetical protein
LGNAPSRGQIINTKFPYAGFDLTAAYPLVDNAELGAEVIRYEMHGSDVPELQGHLGPFNLNQYRKFIAAEGIL